MLNATDHALRLDPEWTIPLGLEHVTGLNPKPDAGATFIRNDGTAVLYPFAKLRSEAWKRGKHLLRLGLKKGDRLGFIVPEPEEFVLTFLGACCVGIVPVPLYPPLGMGKLDAYMAASSRILTTAGARMVLTTKRIQPILWSLLDTTECLEQIIGVDKLTGPTPDVRVEMVQPDDIAFLQFTSGSTAAPKGVVVTHRSLGANGFAIMRHGLEVDINRDKCLAWLPLYHDMGLIGFVIAPLTCGLESVLVPTMKFIKRPSTWMQLMSDHKATITFAPNFAYGLAAKRTREDQAKEMDLSHVRVLGAGAEPNNPATLSAFLDRFGPAGLPAGAMMPVYGMAEATLAMSFSPLKRGLRVDRVDPETYQGQGEAIPSNRAETALEYVGCGEVFADHELVVMDEAGNELPDRQVGELVFRGPSVAHSYWQNPEATEACFREDGLRTGDLGYRVEGEIFVTGRKKDLIILNGRNYDPQSIEWIVEAVPGIRKGNVIAFSRPGDPTEELVVVAEAKNGIDTTEVMDLVRKTVREELFLSPADVCLSGPGTLPKTTSGKLQRSKARLQYLDGTLGQEGDRSAGNKGQARTLAKHLTKSTVSRVKHGLKSLRRAK
ncbi:MAG: fatty-acyl-CoA synthase [Myxococcota bacterium]|jgi:fatty-acyl-CoA synthase